MKKTLVVANWKMAPRNLLEAKSLLSSLKRLANKSNVSLVVAPPAPFISSFGASLRGGNLFLGAQDVSFYEGGAHTGEYSAAMLRSCNVSYVIVGHSERRGAGETNDMVAKKVRAALDAKLKVILCIGEHNRDKDGEYLEELRTQMRESLHGIFASDLKNMVIAYEPVWAIGRTAAFALPSSELVQTALFIRKVLSELFDNGSALSLQILYGGSVERGNAESIAECGAVTGALVGHASLSSEEFADVVAAFDQ